MDKTYTLSGMHCGACVARTSKALSGFADKVQVTLDPPQAVLRGVHSDASLEVMQIALAGAGKYTMEIAAPTFGANISGNSGAGDREGFFATYKPLLLIVGFLVGVTWLVHAQTSGRYWHEWMSDFMAGFFLVFSFFKLLNLSGFVQAYRGYDLIAAKSAAYAWAYPFIELALGVAYLMRWQPQVTHWATLVVMLISAAGVFNALRKRHIIECACLGTVFKLPMSKVTLIEDLSMAAMAAVMLVQR
ncbi:MAG: heavy-metal-associated domain-containing protein [Rhizobacter sp.]|nr:heavy-metal-associated domain-containing protein [Burkholderiales bacterium]